jgi:hypothetical protein
VRYRPSVRTSPGTLAAVVARAAPTMTPSIASSIAPTSKRRATAPPARTKSPPSSPPIAVASAEALLAAQLDLRGSVSLAESLAQAASVAAAPSGEIATSIASIESIARDVESVRVRASQRARALSAATVLGTLRGVGAFDEVTAGAIDRATRSIWTPFASWLETQASTAERAIDAAKADAFETLRARSPRDARLAQLDALVEGALVAASSRAHEAVSYAIERRFARDLAAFVATLDASATDADVAPILADGGPLTDAFALGEAQLRARIRHHARATVALLRGAAPEDSV